MKFKTLEVAGIIPALHGMRNPKESWSKSDSLDCDKCLCSNGYGREKCIGWNGEYTCGGKEGVYIGENDLDLATRLVQGGSEHRKFLRQIMVWVDITAPLYWWKEFDTYKVGTTANSTSTMHKLATTPITLDCFEIEDYDGETGCLPISQIECSEYPLYKFIQGQFGLLDMLEFLRLKYLETKDKKYWKELIRWLPESWLQTRTVSLNYENVLHIYNQRQGHKLTEWSSFCDWAETLPYFSIMCLEPLRN